VSALACVVVSARAQTSIRSLTPIIDGHSVGGVTMDLVGNIYIADFGDLVWKITPDGERRVFASGLYGASGNAVDNQGNLLQSSYYGDSVTKIDRAGQSAPLVTSGLSGPVGIAVNRQTSDVYVANCRGNSISKVTPNGVVSSFSKSDLYKCPNGIAIDREGRLYVVNYRDDQMLKIDAHGIASPFATVSTKGLGHLCFKDDRFYVTAFQSHAIYEVTLAGTVTWILGNGDRGIADGLGADARLSFPNGTACHPSARRLYINEFINDSVSTLPPRAMICEIVLEPGTQADLEQE